MATGEREQSIYDYFDSKEMPLSEADAAGRKRTSLTGAAGHRVVAAIWSLVGLRS